MSDNSRSGNFAPKEFASLPADSRGGFSTAIFKRTMAELFDKGAIRLEDYGRSGDLRKKIVRA